MKKGVLNNNTSSSIVRSINFFYLGVLVLFLILGPELILESQNPVGLVDSSHTDYIQYKMVQHPLQPTIFFSELLKMIHRITQKYVRNIKNCIVFVQMKTDLNLQHFKWVLVRQESSGFRNVCVASGFTDPLFW